jgi:PD-(D/E)XK endonuclease
MATTRAIATFTAMGFDVSIPVTESAAYDLVIDDGEVLRRVQCKYCGTARGKVDLRSIHSNAKGYVVKFVPRNAYDWLYILCKDGREYLVRECLHGRNSLSLSQADLLGPVAEAG